MEPSHSSTESATGFETVPVGGMHLGERMRPAEGWVAAVKEGRVVDRERRVKTPTEWAIENAVTRKEGVAGEPGIPVPARSNPARSTVHIGRA